MEHAWVVQTLGKAVDDKTVRRCWQFAVFPADRFGDPHCRDRLALRFCKGRIRSGDFVHGQRGGITASEEEQGKAKGQDDDKKGDQYFAASAHGSVE
ncbi:hypothetical protein GCM10022213_18330 [Parerythrobacter jejuensis]